MQKKIRIFPRKLYKVNLKVVKGASPNNMEVKEYVFRFGKPGKEHYIDIFEKEGYDAAADMKLINRLHPPVSFFDITKIQSRVFWKLNILWGENNDELSMQSIADDFNIRWRIEKKKDITVIDVIYFRG